MPFDSQPAVRYAHQNQARFLTELKELVAIPSVSTDPEKKTIMKSAANWLAARLNTLGFDHVTIFQTPGHPVVFGEWLKAGPSAPTVLIYGHYDVQPPEPLELWTTDPFKSEVRDDILYGRGSSDMKGQIIATMAAIEAIMRTGSLPVNVKYLLEGEEEIGSTNLPAFMAAHKELLKSDLALNPDAGMIGADLPTIVYGLRGLAYFELRVFGPEHDLHSGLFGGIVHNPGQVLCELIAGMHEAQGRVTLPGYYDSVRPVTAEEREELRRLPLDDAFYKAASGASGLSGEVGYSAVERGSARPTLEVNGLLSGFTGEGSKTVLPARAMAKISMRLVPDQDPAEVHRQLKAYLEQHAPADVRWELTAMAGGRAVVTDRDTPATQALANAFFSVWGKRPVFKREGGSIPVVVDMQAILGIPSLLTGFALPDDNAHAPNEKLNLPTWYKGIDALVYFFYNLAAK
jgi:acetylornithine deacetylase/succinyl-diaminopimelate desuccinylase-like protein